MAIEVDAATKRIFLRTDGDFLYVLNGPEVLEAPTAIRQASWGALKAVYR